LSGGLAVFVKTVLQNQSAEDKQFQSSSCNPISSG